MEKIDPKTLNIPNVNFSIGNDDDKRSKIWKQERLKQGFDETETWNLDHTIARFIYPRLKYFSEINNGYPAEDDMDDDKWNKILEKMLFSFSFYAQDDYSDMIDKYVKKNNKQELQKFYDRINEGLELFVKYFCDLWW